MSLTPLALPSRSKLSRFTREIAGFHAENRRDFPWRRTHNPYRILISEVMLQQTQTDRVVGYYQRFLREFPTVRALAEAPLDRVLLQWQGLGYNRRARFLREMARAVVDNHGGRIPRDAEQLRALPGIGSYTASAVCVFAFNQTLPLIETNIRAVYINAFFKDRQDVHDRELLPLIEATIDTEDPREWFYALMDFGSALKRKDRGVTGRSAHYVRQGTFAGSRRQLRGMIIKHLLQYQTLSMKKLPVFGEFQEDTLNQVLEQLVKEGMILGERGIFRLSGA